MMSEFSALCTPDSSTSSAFSSASSSPSSAHSSATSPVSSATKATSTRSVIFRSSRYNNIATVVDDNSLPDPLPILTPPPTPALMDRAVSQPVHLLLPPAVAEPPTASPSLTATISPRRPRDGNDGDRSEEKETDDPAALRRRYGTRSRVKLQGTLSTTTTTTSRVSSTTSPIPEKDSPHIPPPRRHHRDDHPLPLPPSPSSSSSSHSSSHSTRVHPSQILPSEPFHRKAQPSILSAEAAPVNFRGLYNLAGITLFVLTARLVVENILKYGLRMHLTVLQALYSDPNLPCLVVAVCLCTLSPVLAWVLEVAASKRKLGRSGVAWLHTAHIAVVLLAPCVIVPWSSASYVSGLVLVMVGMVLTMKLISYAHVSHDIRTRILEPQPQLQAGLPAPLPAHLDVSALHPQLPATYAPSLRHTFYFMAAPTLIYQLSYPRTASIRPAFLLRRAVELAFCLTLQLLLIEQYLYPTVRNAMMSMSALNYLAILERILKIALPNGCVWLLGFYAVFHSWLNLLAELLRFGDRLFYKDWWNCQDLAAYWASWNLPVHNWVMRHLYAPAIRSGLSPRTSQFLSFLVSAVMHEMLVAVPLRTLRLYAFWGMVAQVPLIAFTKWTTRALKAPVWSNVTFWLVFLVFGQPLMILLYSHAVLSRQAQMVDPATVLVLPPSTP